MNYKLLKFRLISVLLLFFNSCCFAQDSTGAVTDSASNDYDNVADTLITKTVFEDANDSISKWKQSREFGYMVYLDSLLRKKTGLRIDTVSINKGVVNRNRIVPDAATKNSSNAFLNSFPVRIFFWLIAIFFIGFILYKLFFSGGLFVKGYSKTDNAPAIEEPASLNEYSVYNELIHEAESNNDFNLSTRYRYLQSLKRLADHELIAFSADKTNDRYVQELAGYSYQQEFASLTRNYEYIWYGRFKLDAIRYQKLKKEFLVFNKKI